MIDPVDIRSQPGTGGYRLFLPEQVITALRLTEADGNALFITHTNKMQLEWLGQKIWEQYHLLNNAFTAGKARLKRKKRLTVCVLAVALLIAFLSHPIVLLIHVDRMYVNVLVFAVGVICCLQLLKYAAIGFRDFKTGSIDDPQVLELKELILKDFSPGD